MTFALDHADCAAEVVDILAEALTLDETPIPTKVQDNALCFPVLAQEIAADTADAVALYRSCSLVPGAPPAAAATADAGPQCHSLALES
jgi:hypothetical protein